MGGVIMAEIAMVNEFVMDFHVWMATCHKCKAKGIWLAKYAAIKFNGHWVCAECDAEALDLAA
jgi:hypothetical protein